MLLPKGVHILLAALNILASLQHNGAQSCLSQDQAGKHTRRTETNHHRAKSGLPPVHRQGVLVFFRRLGLRGAAAAQHLGFVQPQGHIYRIREVHIVLFAGVHTLFKNRQFFNIFGIGAQHLARLFAQQALVLIQFQTQLTYSYHSASPLSARRPPDRCKRQNSNYNRRRAAARPAPRRQYTARAPAERQSPPIPFGAHRRR